MVRTKTTGDGAQASIRYRTAILLGCTALVAFAPQAADAQDAEAEAGSTVLQTITVEGAGKADDDSKTIVATKSTAGSRMATDIMNTAASVSVVTAKEIQQRAAKSIEEVLQYTPAVTADFYGSDDRFDYYKIRGFDAWAYRDGLTIGDPFGGVREEPYAFERVEVLKGASSTVYGVSDPGGAINYATKLPKTDRFGEVYGTTGSNRRGEIGFDFGDNLTEDDTLSYRLTGKLQNAEKEYDFSQDDEKFIMGGLTWRPTDVTSLSLVYDHLNRDSVPGGGGHPIGTNLDRSVFLGEPDYNYDVTNRNTFSVLFDHDFGNGLTFGSNARYSKSDTGFGYAYINDNSPDYAGTTVERDFYGNAREREDFAVDAHLQYDASFNIVESRTLAGLDYKRHDGAATTYYSAVAPDISWSNPVYSGAPTYATPFAADTTKQSTVGLYIQQDSTFADKLILSVGLRNDWMDLSSVETWKNGAVTTANRSASLSELSKRIGATYRFTHEFAAYASYAESVAPPSVGVDPERGEQVEVGVKYSPDAFPTLFTASVYDLTKTNITRTNPSTALPETIGEVRVRGIDLEAKAEITDNLSLTGGYSYLVSEIVENGTAGNEGNEMGMVPRQTASLWLNYTIDADGQRGDMTVGAGARYIGSYFYTDANTGSTDGNVVFDAAMTYKIRENTSFELNVSNLFDEKYISNAGYGADFYNPGRAVYATIRQTW
jgi:iron complex outermembrane recepter protein